MVKMQNVDKHRCGGTFAAGNTPYVAVDLSLQTPMIWVLLDPSKKNGFRG